MDMEPVKDKEYYKEKYVLGTKEIFIKTMLLRIISSIMTFGIAWTFTGSLTTSWHIMWIDFVLKTILYYAYEYWWFHNRSRWC
jgi:uncharacterized membrane protein